VVQVTIGFIRNEVNGYRGVRRVINALDYWRRSSRWGERFRRALAYNSHTYCCCDRITTPYRKSRYKVGLRSEWERFDVICWALVPNATKGACVAAAGDIVNRSVHQKVGHPGVKAHWTLG
jgi:hypothetical protein